MTPERLAFWRDRLADLRDLDRQRRDLELLWAIYRGAV